MESVIEWFSSTLGQYVSAEVTVFIISMMPILESKGGLVASMLLGVPITTAIPICVIGNIIPIPFILLFIKQIFKWLKRFSFIRPFIEKLEARALKKSKKTDKAEFWGLILFVAIPLPGAGAWMGSLAAALLETDFKKAILANLLGVAIDSLILAIVSYGLIGAIIK